MFCLQLHADILDLLPLFVLLVREYGYVVDVFPDEFTTLILH